MYFTVYRSLIKLWCWLIRKDSDAGRDWGQEEKGTTEDEMDGWHHWLDGCDSQWTLGVGDGQGGLACCHSWGCKDSDMTEWLIWSDDVHDCKLIVLWEMKVKKLWSHLEPEKKKAAGTSNKIVKSIETQWGNRNLEKKNDG